MIFHLGPRVGALVDGQLSPAQAERAWAHVHACATCRAAVEREGWIKRELAVLSFSTPTVSAPRATGTSTADAWPAVTTEPRQRRLAGLAAVGAGSVGAAMFGVLVLGMGPGPSPAQNQLPVTNIETPQTPTTPARVRSENDKSDAAQELAAAWVRMGL
jgi:hypothetical protein